MRIRIATVLLITVMAASFVFAGCDNNKGKMVPTSDTEETYIADQLFKTNESDVEFAIFKIGDYCFEVFLQDGHVQIRDIVTDPGEFGIYMEDGQAAKITADIVRYSGGEEGFWGNIEITDLKVFDLISYEKLFDTVDIRDAKDNVFDAQNDILKYQGSDGNYVIVPFRSEVFFYKDGTRYKTVSLDEIKGQDNLVEYLEK
ncbi:MAG: hypothetical protein J6X33_07010 [Clostridiales bacterium]|nr:hypothetical protein [Clostridiales bacterium]